MGTVVVLMETIMCCWDVPTEHTIKSSRNETNSLHEYILNSWWFICDLQLTLLESSVVVFNIGKFEHPDLLKVCSFCVCSLKRAPQRQALNAMPRGIICLSNTCLEFSTTGRSVLCEVMRSFE